MSHSLKVLALTRYSGLAASSRLRTLQFSPSLASDGIRVDAYPLLSKRYLDKLYRGHGHALIPAFGDYIARLTNRFRFSGYDAWWIEKELFPWLPFACERLWSAWSPPWIVDYDDAIFHNYDLHRSSVARWVLGDKIDRVMRHARLVVAGNDYLADRARLAGAREIAILPTAIELARYAVAPAITDDRPFTIGWIGSPTSAKYLELLKPVLTSMVNPQGAQSVRMVLIGSGKVEWPHIPVEVRPWSESTEVADIKSCDVGVMPLPDDPWERGKCGYKLIQYMACGLPVVASPVGVNREIVQVGVNGFLAETEAEWVAALDTLRRDHDLRRRMGAAGRRMVEERYCVEVMAPRLAQLLRSAAGR